MVSVTEKVHFYDTDMMGIAHHSNHLRWFECGRVEYMRQAGIDLVELMKEGISFPIKSVSCEYISPIRFDDTIVIETRLARLSRAQTVYSFRILRQSDGTVLATGVTQNVFSHADTGKIARLDEVRMAGLKAMYEKDQTEIQ
jgi:acyl-CoA thioester hydrolase